MCTMCNVCMQSQRNVVISLEYVYTHTSTTTVHIKVTQTHAGSDGMCVKWRVLFLIVVVAKDENCVVM